ncbi:SET domain-containing protein [Lentinula edodes]|uniref:SET domain-containing protein n=1 Tax=Lentinula edodes TaxID=5353 RepID=A0A1Q3DVU4_LENED|nr:SET domain-containing protein [Lentinula edodes]
MSTYYYASKRRLGQLSDVEDLAAERQPTPVHENHASLVRSVYQTVWNEFCEWCKQDFANSMNDLGTPPVDANTRVKDAEDSDIVGELGQLNLQERELTTLTDPHTIILEAPFEPPPSYDSCNPVSNNHFTGDDASHMPFLPLADDPSFDWKGYCVNYKYFAWQTKFFDSNLHAMVVEAARRLHEQHGFSYSQIDDTGVLPLSLTAGEDGVLRTVRYQGSSDWAGAKSHPVPAVPVQAEFKELVSQFCNSASCMMGFCDQHVNWFPMPPPRPVSPRMQSSDLFSDIISPCGDDCFILRVPGNTAIETEWTPNEIDTFNMILDYSPDSSPCDLATICKKPCFEIFKRRRRTLPDDNIKRRPAENSLKRPPRLKHTMFNDLNSAQFKPNAPCHHKGPCNLIARGAVVAIPNYVDVDGQAAIALGQKQDVPAVRNVRQLWKPGSWGVGLFLLESADPGELITEYVGELVYELTTESRDDVSMHRQRNYLFNLNATFALDSEFIGNESRYINHSEDTPNCRAQVMMVNGDHRIGIYAQTHIEAGAELFLNYGPEFFKAT